jgi:hypothetical protein
MMASYVSPPSDLASATSEADLVVAGRVTSIHFTTAGAEVRVSLSRVAKGNLAQGSTISLLQAGGLRPTLDWSGAIWGDDPAAPVLLPGQYASLFLKKTGSDKYRPEGFTGIYYAKNGVVEALPGNPFRGTVQGLTEESLLNAAVAR